jgi:hypothetical protein
VAHIKSALAAFDVARNQTIKAVIKERFPVALKMRLTTFPSGNTEEAIRHTVADACHEFVFANGVSITKETQFCRIQIEAITEQTGNPEVINLFFEFLPTKTR